ncbi:sulfotransferase family protein [Methylomonas sp. MgM2]
MILEYIGKLIALRSIKHPIFIIGASRSGTSILLQALGQHRQILAMPGEAPFLTSIGGNASLFDTESAEYYRASLKLPLADFYDLLAKLGIETAGGNNYALKQFIKSLLVKKTLASRWSAKTFPSETVAKGLLKVYPGAKFIYIVRNGIDVVHSMTKFHGFRKNDFSSQCSAWHNNFEKYKYLNNFNHAICVRHEELTQEPELFFKNIFSFLDISIDKKSIDFVKNVLVHPLDQTDESGIDALKQFKLRQSPFLSWNREQQSIFREICSHSMQELGYEIT